MTCPELTTAMALVPSWLDNHASAIQAVCAFFGLAGLIWYCFLTRGIHVAALSQASAAIRPFIVLDEMTEVDFPGFRMSLLPVSQQKIYIIRNLGSGPALDIKCALGSDARDKADAQWHDLGDLAVDDWSHIFITAKSSYLFVRPSEGIVFRFKDSAGTEHETVEEVRDGHFYQRCRLRDEKRKY